VSNQKVTDEKAREIAAAYVSPICQGRNPKSKAELAEQFKLSQKTVAKAISDAFKKKLITIETHVIPQFKHNETLAGKLLEKFENLKLAVVIDIAGSPDSDFIHKNLGYAMARQIQADPFFFRDGDVVGVGSGRGVYHTISALNGLGNVRVREISIVSLTGSVFSQRTSRRQEFLLDADIHAALLAQHFDGLIQVRPISAPIAQLTPKRSQVIENSWLGTDYCKHLPTHAIVGVGVLSKQHRLYEEIKTSQNAAVLAPIVTPLRKLVDLVDRIIAEDRHDVPYLPVADLCTRLFVVPPPLDMDPKLKRLVEDDIFGLVNVINTHLLTATKTQLQKVKNVILVAGTLNKARAILSLLQHPVARIDTLCTDSDVAHALIAYG
jgi:DNA-binding transcriptional regulator LsrR (DeoR family)